MNALQEELEHAGTLLCSVLDRYLDTCHSVQKHYQHANNGGGSLQALSASVASQFSLIDTLYKTKMKEARSILGQAVNSSSVVVSINSLPPEILVRIFHLVVSGRSCDVKRNSRTKIKFPKYPELLSRVCTRWRRVALGSPTLWSHIDFVLFSSWRPGLEARAKACAARAGNSLLDIHVYEPAFDEVYDEDNLVNFISAIAPRTRSLEYVLSEASTWFDETVINCCFNNCVPGTFTELTILNYGDPAETFIGPANPGNAEWLPLAIETEILAKLLLPVATLRLSGVFLPWTHAAYHGLVELRLHSLVSRPPGGISALEMANILSSSSRLRILDFGLTITDTHSEGSSISPVHLHDLEVLSLTSKTGTPPGAFLQLLSPGSKLLRLSLTFDDIHRNELPLLDGRVRDFIARSNVASLHISNFQCRTYQGISELISPMSNLKVLAMTSVLVTPAVHPTPNADHDLAPSILSRLDTLYMMQSQLKLGHLQQFVRQHPPNKLVFWDCGVNHHSNEELQTIFSLICPVVRYIGRDGPNPLPDWN